MVPETGEVAIPKPNGTLEFWLDGKPLQTSPAITFSSETAAIEFAKMRGWKEILPAV